MPWRSGKLRVISSAELRFSPPLASGAPKYQSKTKNDKPKRCAQASSCSTAQAEPSSQPESG